MHCRSTTTLVVAAMTGTAALPALAGQRRRRRLGAAAAALLLLAAIAPCARGQEGCLTNPTLPECEGYTIHEAVLQSDLAKLCSSSALGGRSYSGWPAACTLWNECRQGRGSGPACRPLALLQTACNEAILSAGPASTICMT